MHFSIWIYAGGEGHYVPPLLPLLPPSPQGMIRQKYPGADRVKHGPTNDLISQNNIITLAANQVWCHVRQYTGYSSLCDILQNIVKFLILQLFFLISSNF